MKAADIYQIILIVLGIIATILLGVFVSREIYPEYKIYQNAYVKLEEFRSTYTGEPPSAFKEEVKQILLPSKDNGPEKIDRCISCHVALQLPSFSPTVIAHNINGSIMLDKDGKPLQQPNQDYIWQKLDEKIAELSDPLANEKLENEGESSKVKSGLSYAEELKSLKVAHVDKNVYDMQKVLQMHPLIGRETRPFEYHAVEEFGCTVCHGGNGRGLVTDKAHGPIFDGQYTEAPNGESLVFTEEDPANDPPFARQFNHEPDDHLIFHTTPLLIGPLMQAKCVQCHQPSSVELSGAINDIKEIVSRKEQHRQLLQQSLQEELTSLQTLLEIRKSINEIGFETTLSQLKEDKKSPHLTHAEIENLASQLRYLTLAAGSEQTLRNSPDELNKRIKDKLDQDIGQLLGNLDSLPILSEALEKGKEAFEASINKLFAEQAHKPKGFLFNKMAALHTEDDVIQQVKQSHESLNKTLSNQKVTAAVKSSVDEMTTNYQRGEQLFVSQACYACHRISGISHGGVGPELTRSGLSYPWFIKESIVWPQADLHSSTMPNFELDHEELQDIMTFLMAQRGESKAIAQAKNQAMLKEWEAGKLKSPWERPVGTDEILNLDSSMLVFATQGCASCHKLQGFESNVGFKIEKDSAEVDFEHLLKERLWFSSLFPEDGIGSEIVATLDKHYQEIDQRIVDDVRQGSILEKIEQLIPDGVAAFYAPFKYAKRAKNHYFQLLLNAETDPDKKELLLQEKEAWKQRVHRVMMMYMQEYGFGRLIAPRLNWSGVFRTDQWIMEHFWNPSGHSPRSIMPVMPFDNSKFYALTHMLDVLGQRNTSRLRKMWNYNGFSPDYAFHLHCVQCHGDSLHGNGPVAQWIYPVPKNLRNADFLRNLTKERAIYSITHGVKGTPMPPWGEIASDKELEISTPVLTQGEIVQIVDWMFSGLVGRQVIKSREDVLKWKYTPQDVIKELKNEGKVQDLRPLPISKSVSLNALQASLNPGKPIVQTSASTAEKAKTLSEHDVFEILPNPDGGPDEKLYYIKKVLYTADNLRAGEQFFLDNCAVCHGRDADGSSERAEAMTEAKPRMLTNLDWLHTHDDLRLLRSIKYGVPGTAMTPWGDFTNSLQRLQLVMYIHSRSDEKNIRDQLTNALYHSFDRAEDLIIKVRAKVYESSKQDEQAYQQALKKRDALHINADENDEELIKDSILVQQDLIALQKKVQKHQERDKLFGQLIDAVQRESNLYRTAGEELLSIKGNAGFNEIFLTLLQLNQGRYYIEDDKLHIHSDVPPKEEWESQVQKLLGAIDAHVQLIDQALNSHQQKDLPDIVALKKDRDNLLKLKLKLLPTFEEIRRLRQQQNMYNEKQNMQSLM